MLGPVWTQPPLIVSSSSESDCPSQRTRSTITQQTNSSAHGPAMTSNDADDNESKMQSFDSAETDDEIMNIMQHPNQRLGHAPIGSPLHRWTTPRIANRKVIGADGVGSAGGAFDSAFDVDAPPSFAHNTGQVDGNSNFFATGFSPKEFDFQDKFDFQSKDFHGSHTSRIQSREAKVNDVVHHGFDQAPGFHEASFDGNSLNPDDCRSLDINEINDLVNASPPNLNAFRYHKDGDNPSVSFYSEHLSEPRSEVSSYMDLTHGETSTDMSTTVKSLQSSPHSVMELDSTNDASKSRRMKIYGTNLNTNSFSEASHTRDSCDDDSSSFVSRRHGLNARIRVGKISDRGSSAPRKDVSVVDKIVNSSPLTKLHEFITGEALCCTTRGQPLIRTSSKKYKEYDETSYEDDGTYNDDLTDYNDEDTKSYASSHYHCHKRGGSASAFSVESSYYTTDDDETSRASTRSRQSSHHYRGSSYNSSVVESSCRPEEEIVQPTVSVRSSPGRSLSRGRSPTIREGYNSDRSLSLGGSSGSFHSDEKHVQGTEIKECDSEGMSVAESVLGKDEAAWMAMTEPSPKKVGQTNSTIRSDCTEQVDSESFSSPSNSVTSSESTPSETQNNVSMNSTQSDFMLRLQRRTASARPKKSAPTKDDSERAMNEDKTPAPSKPTSNIPAEVDGYFKKLLSVGIHLQLNDPPSANGSHCEKRQGKLLLRFHGGTEAKFESPFFIWRDLNEKPSSFSAPESDNNIESILLSDIQTIRKPRGTELVRYPLVTPEHCFVLSTQSGIALVFEAINAVQLVRVTIGLNGVLEKLEKDINAGDNAWIMQSLASVKQTARDVQPCISKTDVGMKKTLLQEAAARRMRRQQQ